MTKEEYRECTRRQNRAVAFLCVVQCWLHGWDGIQIDSNFLKGFLGHKQFKWRRLEWMKEDLKDFFPNMCFDSHEHPFSFFRMVTLSRHQNPQNIGNFKMWDYPSKEYLAKFYERFKPFFDDAANYDERLLAFYLSWLAQVQISPQLKLPVKEEE